MPKRYIYVVFTSTPYKTGTFIRAVTRYPYNHVSVSLDPEVKTLYSYARHYKNAPFYGGFVRESVLRYRNDGKTALIKVCALPVTEKRWEKAKEYIETLERNADDLVYNMFSAALFPFKKKVKIKNSFTCVEFAVHFIRKFVFLPFLEKNRFCSIKSLAANLEKYTVYEGSADRFISGADWNGDTFPEDKGYWFRIRKTVGNNKRLVEKLVKGE